MRIYRARVSSLGKWKYKTRKVEYKGREKREIQKL